MVSKPIKFAKGANREIRDARKYYRKIRRNLMVRFIGEITFVVRDPDGRRVEVKLAAAF